METAPPSTERLEALKTITQVVYGLQALSFFANVPALIAVVINYVKRPDTEGTLYASHFRWQIRTFWFGLLGFAVGVATMVILVGFAIFLVTYLWVIYRVVRGWLALNDGRAMYA